MPILARPSLRALIWKTRYFNKLNFSYWPNWFLQPDWIHLNKTSIPWPMSELVLMVHFVIVLFFIAGFPIGLFWNQSSFRYTHAGLLGGITLLMILGIPCPLTILEEELRNQSYEGSFLANWLNRIIYLEWVNPLDVLIANILFTGLVFSSFWWYPIRK